MSNFLYNAYGRSYGVRKIGATILMAVSLVACRKEHIKPPIPVGDNDGVIVTIDGSHPGYKISPIFEGLSFETEILTKNPEYLNINNNAFIQLIKNLGPGILRIGGGTSDKIDWTGKPRDSNTPANILTTSDIDRLSAFSKAIGWQVLFGLNLGSNNVNASANEALYVYNSIGSNLYAMQFGNEANYFTANRLRNYDYGFNNYLVDWRAYYAAVRAVAPQLSFAGPDVVNSPDWIRSFADNENSEVKLIDGHYYITGPATDPSITYKNLLSDYALSPYIQSIKDASSKYGLPFRITECNNIWGGGKAGVSDIFASALWALNFMWTVAEYNAQGINFHDGQGIIYSPLTMANGVAVVHPEYYAMLAFKYGSTGGTIVPATVTAQGNNCNAYACVNPDGSYSVTLINREEIKNLNFNIQLSQSASTIQVARLTAPSITATTGVTFAGSAVKTDGTFEAGTIEHYTINQKYFTVSMPANSAAVVTIH